MSPFIITGQGNQSHSYKFRFSVHICPNFNTFQMLPQKARKMQGWQIHAYGDLDELQLDQNIKIPALTHPTEVLVKVLASSVNPIDIAMTGNKKCPK